ncbi:hypothetical protein KJ765_02290 [Candidatus Micrarchaeota archaeon]|nr:hypothetical protein [Candidatus Micrarchaeota archaeon]
MNREQVQKAIEEAIKEKGSRKFTQSVDLAINFQDVDFKKPENRISVDVTLPYPAKEVKVGIFAEGQTALEARKAADMVITTEEIQAYAGDRKKQKSLLNYTFLAQPQMMALVGKTFGQVLGAHGKLPKPLLPNQNVEDAVDKARRRINLKTKGRYLPALHCIVAKETLPIDHITENVMTVMEAVRRSVSETQIRNICIKTTMGKPICVN